MTAVSTRKSARSGDLAGAAVRVSGLRIEFPGPPRLQPVRNVSFEVEHGETLAIVGESGSGKSLTAMAVMGLLPRGGMVVAGEIVVDGMSVLDLSDSQLRSYRSKTAAIVFQDALAALNPVKPVGAIITQAIRRHQSCTKQMALDQGAAILASVGVPSPARALKRYPHELSGGLRQRIMVGLALVNEPRLLIADEPTTALDATVQAQLLALLRDQAVDRATIVITHDLAVASQISDRIAVMYAGRIVEAGPTSRIIEHPKHHYTSRLLQAVVRFDPEQEISGIPGEPVDAGAQVESHCAFAPRCDAAGKICWEQLPGQDDYGADHFAACWFPVGSR